MRTFYQVGWAILWIMLATAINLTAGSQQSQPKTAAGSAAGNYIVPGTLTGIPYRTVGERALRLDAYIQPGPGLRPGVLIVHGGGWIAGSRISFIGQFMELLTGAGYNWFSVDYRLGPDNPYTAALEDLREALRFIRQKARQFRTDPNRLALLGEDAGAHLALLLAAEPSSRVLTVVSLGGFFNLEQLKSFQSEDRFLAVFGPGTPAVERQKILTDASPVSRISPGFPPALLVHGSRDAEVSIEQALQFSGRLTSAGVPCQLIKVDGGIHRPENWLPSQWSYKKELLDWLSNWLGPIEHTAPRGTAAGNLKKDIVYRFFKGPKGDMPLLMDAYLPGSDDPVPAVILVHGGGWEAGDKVTYLTPVFEPLAKSGLAWFSIDYRLTPQVFIWDQLEDVRRAIRFVRHHATRFNIDPARIALLGESAGGQLVVQVAALPCAGNPESPDPVEREPCQVQGVVSFYGVYDFLPMVKDLAPRSLGVRLFGLTELSDRTRKLLRENSPLYTVQAGIPPLLLINGSGEFLWQQAQDISTRLSELKVDFRLLALEGAPHGMENWEGRPQWQHYKAEMVKWLSAKLGLKGPGIRRESQIQ